MSEPVEIPADVPGLWDGYREWLHEKGVSSPNVVLHGGYGKNNLGDDAILDVLLERTRKHLPGARVTVVCHGPEPVRERYADVPGLTACHFKSLAAARAIATSHIYIIGGGGIVNRINAYSGREKMKLLDMKGKFQFLAAAAAKVAGARTHFYAIGATSFPDPGVKLLSQIVLRSADTVSVRDLLTLRNLRALGIEREIVHVLDPALSLLPAEPAEGERVLDRWKCPRSERLRIGTDFRYVRDGVTDNDVKVRAVARLVRHLIDVEGCDVVFIPASQHPTEHFEDDLDFGRKVRGELGPNERFGLVESYHHPKVMMAILGAMSLNVLERLHPAILSTMMKVPTFVVSYDDKVTQFVEQIGATDRLMTSEAFVEKAEKESFEWIGPVIRAARALRAGAERNPVTS